MARLKPPTGGIEKGLQTETTGPAGAYMTQQPQPFAIAPTEQRIISETRVERDGDGNITRVVKSRRPNPLNDALVDLDSDSPDDDDGEGGEDEEEAEEAEEEWGGIQGGGEDENQTEVVRELERQANKPVKRQRRLASAREVEWLGKLAERYGGDIKGMARDMRLNPMQQTAGELGKRLKAAFGSDWAEMVTG